MRNSTVPQQPGSEFLKVQTTGVKLAAPQFDDGNAQAIGRQGRLAPHLDTGNVRILVVEDSPTQARLLLDVLEDQGFEADAAPNGERGLTMFDASDFDL